MKNKITLLAMLTTSTLLMGCQTNVKELENLDTEISINNEHTEMYIRPETATEGYIDNEESYDNSLGVHFELRKVTSKGATVVFKQYDDQIKDEIYFGDDFRLESDKSGKWEELPIVVEGSYGFNDIAYIVKPGNETAVELDWSWLYGELEPGEYRIIKTICQNEIVAYFTLN